VPYSGYKHGGVDLQLELALRDGVIAGEGWAWLPTMVATEHPVRVSAQTVDGMLIGLDCEVEVLEQFPYYEGGTLELHLELRKYGRTLRGEYRCVATVVEEEAREEAWRKTFSMDYPASMIRGRVHSGTRTSRTIVPSEGGYGDQPPVWARGTIEPLPPPVDEQPALARHPRLLLTPAEAEALRARCTGGGLPGSWYEALPEQLADPGSAGALESGEALPCPAFLAAGLGFRSQIAGDAAAAERAGGIADELVADWGRDHEQRWQHARALAGLALAYDSAWQHWSPERRRRVAGLLAEEAWHLAGLEGMVRDSVYNDTGLIGSPMSPATPRLGLLRAAAGLALLAIHGDELPADCAVDAGELAQAREVCSRSVRRYLAHSFGVDGCPVGHSAADESVELSQLRFEAGLTSNIDVVSAQQDQARADELEIQTLYDYYLAQANLAKAVGDVTAFLD